MNALNRDFIDFLSVPPQIGKVAGPDIGRQPLIRTGRLTLRPISEKDAADIAAGLDNFQVARMLTSVPQPYHLEDAEEWMDQIAAGPNAGWVFAITLGGIRAILQSGADAANENVPDRLVGIIAIEWRCLLGREGWHIGYWLREDEWGKGIMTEALNAVLARFFAQHMGEVLYSFVLVDNAASRRVQARLGFDTTGVGEVFSTGRNRTVKAILTEVSFGSYMPN